MVVYQGGRDFMSSLHATFWFTPVILFTHKDLATSESGFSSEDIYTTVRNSHNITHVHIQWSLYVNMSDIDYKANHAYSKTRCPGGHPSRKSCALMLLNFNDWSISHSNTLLSHRIKFCGTTHPFIHLIFMGEDFSCCSRSHRTLYTETFWLYLFNQFPDSILVLWSPRSTVHATFIAYLS